MQNCQAYQVSHHSLSILSLIQGIPTELAGGRREGVSNRMGHSTGSSLASIQSRLFAGPPSPHLWGRG